MRVFPLYINFLLLIGTYMALLKKKTNKSRNQYVLLMKDFDEQMYLLPVLGKEIYRVIVQT